MHTPPISRDCLKISSLVPRLPAARFLEHMLIITLLLMMCLIALEQANPATRPMGRDSGIYAYVGSLTLQGRTPYLAASERKTPGIFFLDALGLWLGGGSRWGIWTVEMLFLAAGALAGFYAMQKAAGRGSALLASGLWLFGLGPVLQGGNLTEEYALPFSFVSMYLFLALRPKRRSPWLWGAIGLMFGCSFLLRPNNTGVQIAILLTVVLLAAFGQRSLRGAAAQFCAAGVEFLLPLALVSLYLAANGAFGAFVNSAFVYSLSYAGSMDPIETLRSGFGFVGLPAFVGLAGVLWSASELIRTRIRGGGASPLALWLCLAFVTEVLFSALSGRDYRHYFINWMPWIAFGAAMLFSRTFSPVADTVRSALLPVTFGLVLGLGLLYRHAFGMYANAVAQLARGSPPPQISEPVPDYVSTNTAAGERVLVWGGHASINFLSGREEPTPYFFYPLFVDSPVTERMSAQFLRDLQSNPPALIVDPAAAIGVAELVPLSVPDPLEWYEAHGVYAPPYLSQFFGFLEAHYMRETTVESMVIYRLRGQQAVKA